MSDTQSSGGINRKKAGKGGGSKKYGRNRSATHRGHKHSPSSANYKAREQRGETAKAKRVARALIAGINQTGWFLTSKGKAQRAS